jgi:multiple sugar transport system permease protein
LSPTGADQVGARQRGAPRLVSAGQLLVAGYVLLLAVFGILPTAYGIYFAFSNAGNTFAGLSNFIGAYRDFRFLPAAGHVGMYLIIWLAFLVVLVTGLAITLQQLPARG